MNPNSDGTDIRRLIGRALVPYSERPDAAGVARLVDELITAGEALHAEVAAVTADRRTERAGSALAEWSYFVDAGPAGRGDHANWNHARTLARILRNLASALGEQPSRAR
ncbi:hypothetical protein Slala03_65480 [Streptomyces lavendulae subsp. lavendulae]|uniref:DUF6415 family natural product biosynthesis protein n=1 Tax=Streptomyces lavendulae TaxID=1914 RepID=UPI0024A1C666|nr:DUF6415 family natural product biosynthesis protein [Streptomyces lavendulae]GLV86859.1 hypothetical protein Slala03_65480 [Streptomyces lavendulae subsp. lavendulae]